MMTCNDFKTWLGNKDLLGQSAEGQAREHMDSCEQCNKLAEVDSLLEYRISEGFQQVEPPREFFARLEMDIMSAERTERVEILSTSPWKKLVPALAMAALVLIIVLNPFGGKIGSIDQIGSYALANHLNPELTMAFKMEDVADVTGWFESRVGFSPHLPRRNMQGLTLLGGRECYWGKNKAAYLICDKSGKKVSVFIIDPSTLDFTLERDRSYSIQDRGHEIKIWKEKEQVFAMVI